MRKEHDFLGEIEIPKESYIGIHTARAVENFAVSGYKIDEDFIKAYGLVKLACVKTIEEFCPLTPTLSPQGRGSDPNALTTRKDEGNAPTLSPQPTNGGGTCNNTSRLTPHASLIQACEELAEGKLSEYIVVDALQGGAGTSLNMNINEVIANRALEIMGKEKGDYETISPLNDVNKFQSTNDTYPTALKIAAIFKLRKLEQIIIELQEALQIKEREFSAIVKIGRTQLQEAVLTTLGKEFSAYSEGISRDRWRIYKCEERLRVVNLGGTAIGTGLGAPKKYIFKVVEELRDLTGIGLARAENLVENTQNADVFAEVSGILKAHATNLIKISNDLRLMTCLEEIKLPAVQAGSSIMPGKVNPVIAEMVSQIGLKVLGNDSIISHACALGQLELNQNMPLIAFSLLESLNLLINANKIFTEKCIKGIEANKEKIKQELHSSTATLTALLPKLGYDKLCEISQKIQKEKIDIKKYILDNDLMSEEDFDYLISAECVLAL